MKFAHIADVHLGKKVDEGTRWEKNAIREIYDGFTHLVDLLELEAPDFLFITGDLFDHVPNIDELKLVDIQLARLEKTNIIYVTGEADYLKKGSAIWKYKFMSRTYLLNCMEFNNCVPEDERPKRNSYADGIVDSIYFPEFNLDIYGICQYNQTNTRNDLDYVYAHDLDRKNILLGHGGSKTVAPFDVEDVKVKKFDYIGMGHFHNSKIIEEMKLYYPGSPEPFEPESTGEHGYIKGYMDKSVCSCKFVPTAMRKYKTIYVEADEQLTNSKLIEYVENSCKKEPKAIYSIEIKRSKECYTDFDLSRLLKKYYIIKIKGDQAVGVDFMKLEYMNEDNALGRNLKRIRESKSQYANSAFVAYAHNMSKLLWGSDNVEIVARVADKREALKADKVLTEQTQKHIEMYKQQMKTLMSERDRVTEKLKEYPDMTGELNVVRAQIKEKEFLIDQVRFKDAQVDKIYNRKRLGVVLLIDAPVVILLAYHVTVELIQCLLFDDMMDWVIRLGIYIIALVTLTLIGITSYNKTKNYRKKRFGTRIPHEEHTKNKLMMAQLEDELAENFAVEAKYSANHEINKKLNVRLKSIMDKMEEIEAGYKRDALVINDESLSISEN